MCSEGLFFGGGVVCFFCCIPVHTSALKCLHAASHSAVCVCVSCSVMCSPRAACQHCSHCGCNPSISSPWRGKRAVTPSNVCACVNDNILGRLNMCRIVSVFLDGSVPAFVRGAHTDHVTQIAKRALDITHPPPTLTVCSCAQSLSIQAGL